MIAAAPEAPRRRERRAAAGALEAAMVDQILQWIAFHPIEAAVIAIIILLFVRSIRVARLMCVATT